IAYRRRLCLLAGICGQIIVFGVTGQKSILFSALFLTVLSLVIKRWKQSFGMVLTAALIAAGFIGSFGDDTNQGVYFSSLIARRTLITPGQLTGFYFEHFSQVSHAGMGFHFSRWAPPFFGPPQEIGLVYFGGNVDANASLWAEGFAEFGI